MARDYMDKLKWKPGTVKEKHGDLHYSIWLDDGRCWRRHIDQLRKINSSATVNLEKETTHEVNYEPSDLVLEGRTDAAKPSDSEREAIGDADIPEQSFSTPTNSLGSPFIGFENSILEQILEEIFDYHTI